MSRVRACAKREARNRLHLAQQKAAESCRNRSNVGHPWDGSCLRCDAAVGEACRPLVMGMIPNPANSKARS